MWNNGSFGLRMWKKGSFAFQCQIRALLQKEARRFISMCLHIEPMHQSRPLFDYFWKNLSHIYRTCPIYIEKRPTERYSYVFICIHMYTATYYRDLFEELVLYMYRTCPIYMKSDLLERPIERAREREGYSYICSDLEQRPIWRTCPI